MPIRRILVDLELAALADPDASGDVLLVITPDGVLKRQEIPPPMSTLTYGPGTYDLVVPPGVTSLQVEAQAPGGGAAGAGTTGTPGTPGTDGGNTEILRAGVQVTDPAGDDVEGVVSHPDLNTTHIHFDVPVAGIADLS